MPLFSDRLELPDHVRERAAGLEGIDAALRALTIARRLALWTGVLFVCLGGLALAEGLRRPTGTIGPTDRLVQALLGGSMIVGALLLLWPAVRCRPILATATARVRGLMVMTMVGAVVLCVPLVAGLVMVAMALVGMKAAPGAGPIVLGGFVALVAPAAALGASLWTWLRHGRVFLAMGDAG